MICTQSLTGARLQALMMTVGLCTFFLAGVAACLALVVGVFYLVVSFVLLVLQAIVEVCANLAGLWSNADSLVKLLIVVALVYGVSRFSQSWAARKKVGRVCPSGFSS